MQYTRARFDALPPLLRGLVANAVRGNIKKMLWAQGVSRHADEDIFDAAIQDWRALLRFRSDGPFFFGDEPTTVDAIVFGALATTVLTPIESPIRDFLRSQAGVVEYAERMRARLFPELVKEAPRRAA